VADTLAEWNAPADRDTAVLLVSELVSNAVVHARTDISLTLRWDRSVITVEVRDGSDRLPAPCDVPPVATSGRGLQIVDRMARSWGVRRIPGDGKITWFSLASEQPVPSDGPLGTREEPASRSSSRPATTRGGGCV